jgi:hypothetical protein
MSLTLDMVLALAALVVAVVGTLKDDFSTRAKRILVGVAAATCLIAVVKAVGDDHDKAFMKTALISTLVPSNSSYVKLVPEVEAAGEKRHFGDSPCHHSSDGMVCFFSSKSDQSIHATFVVNRSEVAQMYANDIDKTSNERLIDAAFDHPYTPTNDWDEDFANKAGMLGMAVCYNMFDHWGSDYNYDPSFGLKVECETPKGNKEAHITTEELTKLRNGTPSEAFYNLEQIFRDQYKPSDT